MEKLLNNLNIKHSEKQLVFLMLLFSFGVGVAVSFLKTIADASFIIQFGIVKVPEAIILGGILGYISNTLIGALLKKWGFGRSTKLLSIIASIILTTFCALLIFKKAVASPIYWLFVVSMPLSDILENAFNGTIMRYLNFEQNKRLSGLLTSGMVFSGIIGCFLIPVLKSALPKSEYLLLFAALGCIMSLSIFLSINKQYTIHESLSSTNQKSIALPIKSKYFWQMVIFILISAGLFYIINFGFLYLLGDIKKNYNADLVILLISIMNGTIKLSEFALTLVSGKMLAKRGVAFGTIALPISLLIFIFLAFVFTEAHQFWIFFGCIVMTKFVERVIRKGLLRPSLNVLYQLFDEKKSKVQHFLDGNVASLSAIFFGVLLYILVKFVHDDLTIPFSFSTTIITGIWVVLTIAIAVQYRHELFKKLKTALPKKSTHISDLLYHSSFYVPKIFVNGTLHLQLSQPMLIIDNSTIDIDDSPKELSKEIIKENQKLIIDYDKLIYLLITHYKLETNPFYAEMSNYFVNEIRDEINAIGTLLSTKYNQWRLKNTFKVIYNSSNPEEQLYAFELLTATVNKDDKKKLQLVYNLITSSELEKTLFYHLHGDKKGLRKIMKAIITEEQFKFSPILISSAIHVLGQNYVLKVPQEIIDAASSQNELIKEMAGYVIAYDTLHHNETLEHTILQTGVKWKIIDALEKIKAFELLGNNSLYELMLQAEKPTSVDLNNKGGYVFINNWINIQFNNQVELENIKDDLLYIESIESVNISSDTVILYWSSVTLNKLLQNK